LLHPQMCTLKNAAIFMVPKNNISKSTKLESFCEISFFSSNL